MKTKTKTVILLTTLFIMINIAIYAITQINKQQRVQIALDNHLNKLQTHYEILRYHQKITANASYKSTINTKEVITILSKVQTANRNERKVLRKQLYEILKSKYKILKTKGVLQYHFILPNNRTFLRMHKPNKFGDDLTNIRYSFEYTNQTKKSIRGFEQGRTAHGFRNVYPIFDKNRNYLAAVEISFSSELLQEYLDKVSKIHTHFLINKHIFDVKAWKRDDLIFKYTPSSEHENYMMSIIQNNYNKKRHMENRKRIKPIKTEINKKMALNKKFALYTSWNDEIVVISFYPIKNIKEKKTVAWIVSYARDNFIEMTLKSNFWIQIISFFVLWILFYFAYRVVNQKEILNTLVKVKTKKLTLSEQKLQLLNENLEQKVKEEVEKNQEKDRLIFQQSKMASMGEMIGNIAHQWRQPIAIISMWANNIIADIDMEEIDETNLREYASNINSQTQHLSQTIDDFRNFFTPNREKNSFTLKHSIDKTMKLLTASFKTHNIEVIENIEDIEIKSLENELTQALLNIIKNAKDILVTTSKRKLIFITIYQKNSRAIIEIKDSGGGVPKDIIDKIYEPYFTTKHKSQGTGIGLYMTQSIITKHLHGEISVKNMEYEYEGEKYKGAEFRIEIPLA